jgi:hypothetical protein
MVTPQSLFVSGEMRAMFWAPRPCPRRLFETYPGLESADHLKKMNAAVFWIATDVEQHPKIGAVENLKTCGAMPITLKARPSS